MRFQNWADYLHLRVFHRDEAQPAAALDHSHDYIALLFLDVGFPYAGLAARHKRLIGLNLATEQASLLRGLTDAMAQVPDRLVIRHLDSQVSADLQGTHSLLRFQDHRNGGEP